MSGGEGQNDLTELEVKSEGQGAREGEGDGESGEEKMGGQSVQVAGVSAQDARLWDTEEGWTERYLSAGDIVQDVVLLGTPVGADVSNSVPPSPI